MLTLIILGIVIVIPLLLLVSFGWVPQPHTKEPPLEKREGSTLGDKSSNEESDDSPHY